MRYLAPVDMSELIGHTVREIKGGVGDEELIFVVENGDRFVMGHMQTCCEEVTVEDICGDLSNLIGLPILMSEMVSDTESRTEKDKKAERFLWTFCKVGTNRGCVTLRWYGESNGYYSVTVDCYWLEPDTRKNSQ